MTAPGAGTPAATTPGRSLGDDWPAIAAHAAHHGITAPAEALASWRALSEARRVAWRASADAVVMLIDAQAVAAIKAEADAVHALEAERDSLTGRVAELVTEGSELRGLVAEMCGVLAMGAKDGRNNTYVVRCRQRAGLTEDGDGGRDEA